MIKIINIDKENVHIFQSTRGISMKFSGKMRLMIILKVIKKQGFTLSVENTVYNFQNKSIYSNYISSNIKGLSLMT